jgi:hypothetical protein
MRFLKKTQSICNECLKKIPARTFEKKGRVFLEKTCPEHGKFSGDHVWDDPEIYKGLTQIKTLGAKSAQVTVAVTYQCNLNCPVCYAKANEVAIPDLDFSDLDKVKDYPVVFLTGGEPTIRKDLIQILRRLKKEGKKIVMFSNGLKLANLNYVRKLKKAGLGYVILQFDSVNDDEYEYMRGMKLIDIKKKAVENMQQCHLPVYFQSVMLRDKTFKRMEDIFMFARKYPIIKTINVTPLWRLGRYDEKDFVPSSQILAKASKINGVSKEDWLESTNLLCGVDKLISMVKPRRRVFCKCNLKCLVMHHEDKTIPVTKIFDTKRINKKIIYLYERKSLVDFLFFLLYFFSNQVILNFFKNKNFRIMVKKMIRNSGHLLRKDFLLFNPFNFITLAIFPTPNNLDFDFVDECNFHAISSEDFGYEPGCIHRIRALKKEEKRGVK